jgi:hypothetical protein
MNAVVWLKRVAWALGLLAAGVAVAVAVAVARQSSLGKAATWQKMASPGKLSAAHAFLEDDCAACHTPVQGTDPAKCIACHADDESLLKRRPTAFHADVGSCRECHGEHQGDRRQLANMDHAALTKIGLRRRDGDDQSRRDEVISWIKRLDDAGVNPDGPPHLAPAEAVLDCVACHAEKDHHFRLFGTDCAQCHATTKWTIPEFRHPSPRSTDCAQCHQAPPSHYMMHFQMVSMTVARQEHARVDQCYLCHQTTAWNDIKGVGWYKHH